MYVLYVKEKKPEEKVDEKTKPGVIETPSQFNKTTKWSAHLKREAAALWSD